nr:hypothetical protein [Tanacetum cinerariifolium]
MFIQLKPAKLLHDLPIWLALKIKFEGLHASNTLCRSSAIRLRDQDDRHDDAHPEGENSAKRQKTSGHRNYVFRESSSNFSLTISTKAHSGRSKLPRDPKALALSLVNQDLLYLKKGNSGPEKFMLSLHKFSAVIFFDDDIEERTSRWVEHWKNPQAKIFYIKRQKEQGKPIKEIYSNSKIVQVIKTYGELGNEHKFVTEIILGVKSNQQEVNLTAPTITFPGIEKYKMFSIVFEPVYGIIYKNSKKEKKVTRHQEIHKFCDATLKRVLEGLKSYNNDVKHGYVTSSLSKEDAEYLQLFEEEIKERLKHRDQMRHWEMYVNGRPLGSRRERLE